MIQATAGSPEMTGARKEVNSNSDYNIDLLLAVLRYLACSWYLIIKYFNKGDLAYQTNWLICTFPSM